MLSDVETSVEVLLKSFALLLHEIFESNIELILIAFVGGISDPL